MAAKEENKCSILVGSKYYHSNAGLHRWIKKKNNFLRFKSDFIFSSKLQKNQFCLSVGPRDGVRLLQGGPAPCSLWEFAAFSVL